MQNQRGKQKANAAGNSDKMSPLCLWVQLINFDPPVGQPPRIVVWVTGIKSTVIFFSQCTHQALHLLAKKSARFWLPHETGWVMANCHSCNIFAIRWPVKAPKLFSSHSIRLFPIGQYSSFLQVCMSFTNFCAVFLVISHFGFIAANAYPSCGLSGQSLAYIIWA